MSTNYEKFIAANHALLNCMAQVPADEFKAMSAADQGKVCFTEATAVREHLETGNLSFGSLLKERMASLNAQQ
jgi:hypothetical protein